MERRLRSVARVLACTTAGGVGALVGSVPAGAATASSPTAAKWLCTIDPADAATTAAEVSAGFTGAQVCANSALPGPVGNAQAVNTLAAAAGENPCGYTKQTITDNDPRGGWFHEESEWTMENTGYIWSYVMTDNWANYTTYQSGSYTWTQTGIAANEVSNERDVYSMAGAVQQQETVTGTVWSDIEENNGTCQGTSNVNSFVVAPG